MHDERQEITICTTTILPYPYPPSPPPSSDRENLVRALRPPTSPPFQSNVLPTDKKKTSERKKTKVDTLIPALLSWAMLHSERREGGLTASSLEGGVQVHVKICRSVHTSVDFATGGGGGSFHRRLHRLLLKCLLIKKSGSGNFITIGRREIRMT